MSIAGLRAGLAALLLCLGPASPLLAQKGAKSSARDLFYSEASLIVSSHGSQKGRFAGAKKSVLAVTLGLKYRVWKLVDGQPVKTDPEESFQLGDRVRLGVEVNDTGYLYVVHQQPEGQWRRLFPDPVIEHGAHFVRGGLVYPLPPERWIELQPSSGGERFFVLLAREPVKELEMLVAPRPENSTGGAVVEIPDSALAGARNLLIIKELVTEHSVQEKSVYVVNRTGKPDSLVGVEIRLAAR
ncbi:MAG: DUF4384 domain-containing protein [Acidobacteria bacterium]|nr:DUF4384 domain-containing protein [Acidobacteriota bacterium]